MLIDQTAVVITSIFAKLIYHIFYYDQVIAPEEITNPNVDELSVMTYLSQFPKAVLKPGAPLRPKTNAKKVRAYGKGTPF